MSREGESGKPNPDANRSVGGRGTFIARLQAILRSWPSADRLARATGVSPSAFRKWLRGEAEPSRERLVALAHAAGVSVGWLANGEGPETAASCRDRLPPSPVHTLDQRDYLLLPKRPEAAAAGSSNRPPPPRPIEFVALRQDWVRSTLGIEPEHLLLETAVG